MPFRRPLPAAEECLRGVEQGTHRVGEAHACDRDPSDQQLPGRRARRAPADVRLLGGHVTATVVQREQEPARQPRQPRTVAQPCGRAPRPAAGRRRARPRSPTAATPARCAPARAPGTAAARPRRSRGSEVRGAGQAAQLQVPARGQVHPAVAQVLGAVGDRPQRRRGRLHPAAGSAPAHRPRRRAARTPPGRHRPPPGSRGDARSRAPGHCKHPLGRPRPRRADGYDGRRFACESEPTTPHASGDQEAGASPARSRHCHRAARPTAHPGARNRPASRSEPGTRIPRGGSAMRPRRSGEAVPVILLLSTSDTDLLSARASGAPWSPTRPEPRRRRAARAARRADVVVVRLLGGRAWEDGIDALLAVRRAGGRARRRAGAGRGADGAVDGRRRASPPRRTPTSRRAARTTSPSCTPSCPTPCCSPARASRRPPSAELGRPRRERPPVDDGRAARSRVLYYRAQQLAGNTAFVEALCTAIEDAGARPLPVFCASLRGRPSPAAADAARGRRDGRHRARRRAAPGRRARRRAATTRPGTSARWPRWTSRSCRACASPAAARVGGNDDGLSPLDVATQVAVPEFDGRLITVPFSFKEIDADGPDRLRRRSRAGRAGGRDRGAARPAAAHPDRRQAGRRWCCRRVPDQARPDRQRGRPGHPGQRGRAAGRHARPATATRSATCPASPATATR